MSTFGMPPTYVNAPVPLANSNAGVNLLNPNSYMIRPAIGGAKRRTARRKLRKQRKQKKTKRQQKQSGGFLPSIGEPFVSAVSNYIAPLALFGIYRFMSGKKTRKSRK
jgi:hypothetical protein